MPRTRARHAARPAAVQSSRAAAARAVAEVFRGRSLNAALPAALARVPTPDRALVQALAYGTLRWQPRLNALLTPLLRAPLRQRDADVHGLLLVGLHQLTDTAVPEHAALHETVEAARALGKPWAAGLVNAVLRRFLRERDDRQQAAEAQEPARHAHPQWLIDIYRNAWPDDWPAILAANNAHPPMTLRVNPRHGDRASYQVRLAAAGLAAAPVPHTDWGLTLDTPVDVARLPGFAEGHVSVQDAAAQLAAPLLAPEPGQRVLDACAAPGGKTGHLAEWTRGQTDLTALDLEPARLDRVRDNLARLGHRARLQAADATAPNAWWDGQPFDRMLLDAPCSGTGVIRRHPDIKLLRRPTDIPALAATQHRLLDALWPLLRRGGILLYATCSILPAENADQIAAFLDRHPDAAEDPIRADWGRAMRHGRHILPGDLEMDGFYYARLVKR